MDKVNRIMKQLSNVLESQIDGLKPAEIQPTEDVEWETVSFDFTVKDNTEWKELVSEHIRSAKTFEIQCWNDEIEELILALQYGEIKPSDWKKGTIVEGKATPEFSSMVLDTPKPRDIELYNKMTPFFSIAFNNGFSSEHYGTEIIIRREK